jgi:hypothetical protein
VAAFTGGMTSCMQFRAATASQVRSRQFNDPLRVTVTVRWIPLVTAAYGTRVARPAKRTTPPAPCGDGSQLDRR